MQNQPRATYTLKIIPTNAGVTAYVWKWTITEAVKAAGTWVLERLEIERLAQELRDAGWTFKGAGYDPDQRGFSLIFERPE